MNRIRSVSDQLFCLKQIPIKEADSLFIVFSRKYGRRSIIAKGIRKIKSRNRGNIMPGFLSDVVLYKGQGMPILIEATLLGGFELTNYIDHVSRLLFLLKNILPEAIPETKLFDDLVQLVKDGKLDDYSINKFRIKTLQELGFLQDLSVCSKCFDKKSKMISLEDFSTYCKTCYTKINNMNLISLADISYKSKNLTNALDKWIKTIVWG